MRKNHISGYIDRQNVLRTSVLNARMSFMDTTEAAPEAKVTCDDSTKPSWSLLNIHNIDVLPEYLTNKHRDWIKTSTALMLDDRNAQDERVHCLFYFFGPHPIPFYEENFLKGIWGLAPVKADSLTLVERQCYQQDIEDLVKRMEATVDSPSRFDFQETTVLPEASNAVDEHSNVLPAKRGFGVMNEAHSGVASASVGGAEGGGDLGIAAVVDVSDADALSLSSSSSSESLQSQDIAPVTPEQVPIQADPQTHSSPLDTAPTMVSRVSALDVPKPTDIFAVLCSANESGLREYPWGASVSAYDERVSDFRRLQRLVFGTAHRA